MRRRVLKKLLMALCCCGASVSCSETLYDFDEMQLRDVQTAAMELRDRSGNEAALVSSQREQIAASKDSLAELLSEVEKERDQCVARARRMGARPPKK